MIKLELSPALLTGDVVIDTQHRELISLGHWLSQADLNSTAFLEGIRFLQRYVDSHFSGEEEAMRESGYPQIRGHIKGHEYFLRAVSEVVEASHREGPTLAMRQRLQFLIEDLFMQHIRTQDLLLARWLKKSQVSVDHDRSSAQEQALSWWGRLKQLAS